MDELRESISTRTLERLEYSWDIFYGKLTAFKERFGHCNVGVHWQEDKQLGLWATAQRTNRNTGTLSAERIYKLEKLGFIWDYQSQKAKENWLKWYRELQAYVKEYGNPHVPRTHHNTKLASWVWIQRQRKRGTYKRKGKEADILTNEQIDLLDIIGFSWDIRLDRQLEKEHLIDSRFHDILRFIERRSALDIEEIICDNADLIKSLNEIVDQKNNGDLAENYINHLNEIGFDWEKIDIIDRQWFEMYERLQEYKDKFGNTDVPNKYPEDQKLGNWVALQRLSFKENRLFPKKISLLEKLEFKWKLRTRETWDDRFSELEEFITTHGHSYIPSDYQIHKKLYFFVNSVRFQKRKNLLPLERINKLNSIGFSWEKSN
ncbi:MAG: helicase associated domain-containing protein [Chlamydiia bacterium]